MKRLTFALFMGLLASPGFAQTSEPNPQTQQQILEELRAIHRDMQASTSLQLLLAELQITQTSLDLATQRRDTLKTQVTQLQAEKTTAQAEVDRFGSGMEKVSKPDQEFVDKFQELKDGLTKLTVQEAAATEQLQDAEGRLRAARAEKENVQGQLSDLMKRVSSRN
jgi:chromosome segregation ATPase